LFVHGHRILASRGPRQHELVEAATSPDARSRSDSIYIFVFKKNNTHVIKGHQIFAKIDQAQPQSFEIRGENNPASAV
jgi:hypothetical protein